MSDRTPEALGKRTSDLAFCCSSVLQGRIHYHLPLVETSFDESQGLLQA